jgi:hypothetical protein
MTRVFRSKQFPLNHGRPPPRERAISYSAAAHRAIDRRAGEDAYRTQRVQQPSKYDVRFRTRRPQQQMEIQPRSHPLRIPERYFSLTRSHFAILKCLHHRRMLRKGLPISLQHKAEFLTNSVRPAFQNDMLTVAVEQATNLWCSSVETLLRKHYDETLKEALEHISNDALPENLLDLSLNMVVKWAQRQLGKKLHDTDLDEAMSLIRASQQLTNNERVSQTGLRSSTNLVCNPVCNQSVPQRVCAAVQTDPVLDAVLPVPSKPSPSTAPTTLDLGTQLETSLSESKADTSTDSGLQLLVSSATPPDTESQQVDASVLVNPGFDAGPAAGETPLPETSAHTPAPAPSSQGEGRTSTQTTLFGLPPGRCTSSGPVDFSKENIVFGDSNLVGFSHDNTFVYAPKNGRLSALKGTLTQVSSHYNHVKNFILCLSFLDAGNQPKTNFTVFRTVIYTARKVFPNATLHVLLNALPAGDNDDFRNVSLTNDLIVDHKPAGCILIQPPPRLSSNVKVWDSVFCTEVFNSLRKYLN